MSFKKNLKPTWQKVALLVGGLLLAIFVRNFPTGLFQRAPLGIAVVATLSWLGIMYIASCGIVLGLENISKKRSEKFPASMKKEQ